MERCSTFYFMRVVSTSSNLYFFLKFHSKVSSTYRTNPSKAVRGRFGSLTVKVGITAQSCRGKLLVTYPATSSRLPRSGSRSGKMQSVEHPLEIVYHLPLIGVGEFLGSFRGIEHTGVDSGQEQFEIITTAVVEGAVEVGPVRM